MAISRPQRQEVTPTPPNKSTSNVLSIRSARKASAHDELITATEVRRMGLYEQKLYALVEAGEVTAYKSRFTKYTLYSKRELEQLIDKGLPNSVYRAAQAA